MHFVSVNVGRYLISTSDRLTCYLNSCFKQMANLEVKVKEKKRKKKLQKPVSKRVSLVVHCQFKIRTENFQFGNFAVTWQANDTFQPGSDAIEYKSTDVVESIFINDLIYAKGNSD